MGGIGRRDLISLVGNLLGLLWLLGGRFCLGLLRVGKSHVQVLVMMLVCCGRLVRQIEWASCRVVGWNRSSAHVMARAVSRGQTTEKARSPVGMPRARVGRAVPEGLWDKEEEHDQAEGDDGGDDPEDPTPAEALNDGGADKGHEVLAAQKEQRVDSNAVSTLV